MRNSILLLLATASALTSPAAAQVVGGEWERWAVGYGSDLFNGKTYGRVVQGIGDVNADGYADFLVGSPDSSTNTVNSGSLTLYSGKTGRPVWTDIGTVNGHDHFAASLARIPDLDGDLVDEFLVGATHNDEGRSGNDTGSIFLFSGRGPSLLARVDGLRQNGHFGFSVAHAGDVNGDGVPDLLAGAPDAAFSGTPLAGYARVISGATFQMVLHWDGMVAGDRLGSSVAGVGDWNQDGYDDVLLGAPFAQAGGLAEAGRVDLRSGVDGALIGQWEGSGLGAHFGHALAVMGDLDGDGHSECLISAPESDPSGLIDAGSVFLFSSRNGLLRRFDGTADGQRLGHSIAAAGDVDRDGFDDILLGAPGTAPGGLIGAGAALLYSGRTGALIHTEFGEIPAEQLGYSVARGDDISGDGIPDWIAGAPFSPANMRGRGIVYALSPFLNLATESFSVGSGGTVALDLRFPQEFAGGAYLVVASAHGPGATAVGGLTIPLRHDALLKQTLAGQRPAAAIGFSGLLSGSGQAGALIYAAPGTLPLAWIGRSLTIAALARGPAQGALISSAFRTLTFIP